MKNKYKDIAEIVARVKDKDADAFVELYNNMYHQVYFLALTIVKDEHLAQDVVQETFINVYTSIHSLNNDMTFIAWLNRITYNCSLKMISQKEEVPIDNDLVENVFSTADKEEPLEMVLSKEKAQSMIDMILELPPEYRTVLILKYYEGMKLEEIASCMECSIGTVKSRLSRGKNSLRKNIITSGKLFMLLTVSGFTLTFSIKSYAQENILTVPIAEATLDTVKQKLGITSVLGCKTALVAAGIGSGKGFLVIMAAFMFLLSGSIWRTEIPTITVECPNEFYTNTSVDVIITVNSRIPIKSIQVVSDGDQIPVVAIGQKGLYEVRAEKNGAYQVEVALWNGQKTSKKFEVAKIDKVIPELYWYSWDRENKTFYCLVKDNLSGVNYSKIYQEDLDGTKYPPITYNEDTGEVEFKLLEVPFHIQLYDNGNNFSTYKIESYAYEESLK
ncbi:MAG: RNA polymerase sigma factor [Clostridiaceae bacterium]|nr:RNA polymerase sigma factor [Clostridiaceae bacterium]